MTERIELVVRLIRSKGVGVYFVTQNPLDIPQNILGQLGNRIQHALRAFTPRDQKAVKSAASTMRPNPKLDIENAISELGVGEALVSFLDNQGRPNITERAFICLPAGQIGAINTLQRQKLLQQSPVAGAYDQVLDRESAFERLMKTTPTHEHLRDSSSNTPNKTSDSNLIENLSDWLFGSDNPKNKESLAQTAARSALRSIGVTVGREIARGVLGSILGSQRKRR